ncbi:hypothetical protein AYI70_g4073, partial [Smittium culicis]
MDSILFKSE